MKSILVTTSEQKLFRKIRSCFPSDCRVESATSKQQALDLLLKKRFDLVFIELNILTASVPDENYKEALQPFWQTYPTIEIIVMAPQSHIRKAVRAVKDGASDYLPYPIDTE
ncbi:MAG: sigma-54-dependent Fis family transcriptional regulator, partial [Desulfobacterales bacterium]